MPNTVLQEYIERMKNLQRGQKSDEGPAPHQPLLLLSVIDQIGQGVISENKIFPSPELAEIFHKYWTKVVANRTFRSHMFPMPFFRLRGRGFWHLHPHPGKEAELEKTNIRTVSALVDIVNYATLDDELFALLTNPQNREVIRQTLINTYFSDAHFPDAKSIIENIRMEEQQIGEHRQLLIQSVHDHPFSYQQAVEPVEADTPTRSAAFRKEIMKLYNYSCSVCKLRIVTLDGESATDAAHIIPFSISQNNDIRNGISLCKLHHWAFDTGLISISSTYKVIVSSLMSDRRPTEYLLTEYRDKSLLLPEHNQMYPAQKALEWHRYNRLKKQ